MYCSSPAANCAIYLYNTRLCSKRKQSGSAGWQDGAPHHTLKSKYVILFINAQLITMGDAIHFGVRVPNNCLTF